MMEVALKKCLATCFIRHLKENDKESQTLVSLLNLFILYIYLYLQ